MTRKKQELDAFEQVLEDKSQRNNIYFKLWKAKQEIGKVVKGNDNPFFKSKYADLNSILEAVEPSLHKYELIVLQPCIGNLVETQIIDCESGQMVTSYLELPEITDPQKKIASVSYYRRATLQSLLSLQAVDDDGNEARKGAVENKPLINGERFQKALSAIAKGEASINDLKNNFTLTAEQQHDLNMIDL
jgi:hypothetical protein